MSTNQSNQTVLTVDNDKFAELLHRCTLNAVGFLECNNSRSKIGCSDHMNGFFTGGMMTCGKLFESIQLDFSEKDTN